MAVEMTIEQKRAIAIAKARLRLKQSEDNRNPPPETRPDILPAFGQAARMGIEGVGAIADMASPWLNLILPESMEIKGKSGEVLSDLIGLPKPQTDFGKKVHEVGKVAVGGGMMGGAKTLPQLASLFSGSAAGEYAKDNDVGLLGQVGATVAGGFAPAALTRIGQGVSKQALDIGSAVGASYGNQRSINRLASDAAQRSAGDSRQQILSAIANRKTPVPGVNPTVAESIAQRQVGQPGQFGGETIRLQRDLSGIKGAGDILPGSDRTREVLLKDFKKATEANLAPVRENALQSVNSQGGADANMVLSRIDAMLKDSSISKLGETVLSRVRNRINSKVGKGVDPGKIDAKRLYTIRKELASTIKKASKKTEDWDAASSSKLQREIQLAIDDAFEASGAPQWRADYMQPYAARMDAVRQVKDVVKEAKGISKNVKTQSASQLAGADVPQFPGLLSRPVSATNWALKLISRDANTPVAKEIAKRMLDPDEYAKLLKTDPKTPFGAEVRKVLEQAAAISALQQSEQMQ